MASLVSNMLAINFRGRKELGFIDIRDSGLSEDLFDTIVRNDDSNTNEEKRDLFSQRFSKFLR